MSTLKRKQVEYCVDGYNSFRSVEHKGLLNLLQTCVDYGAKYSKFDMAQILYSRDAVSRATVSMAAEMITVITEVHVNKNNYIIFHQFCEKPCERIFARFGTALRLGNVINM